jgi:RHS repeat-associated protein
MPDLGVANGTLYNYVAKAVDTAGNSSVPSTQVSATPSSQGNGGSGGSGGGGVNPRPRGSIENLRPWRDGPTTAIAEATAVAPHEIVGQPPAARILFLHSDHLGSLRLVTDLSGHVVSEHKYSAFGEEIQPMHSLDPFRYAGYERDTESGLDYAMARYYNPSRGRWQSPDPLPGGGFVYAGNTPLNAFDPTGLYCFGVTTKEIYKDGTTHITTSLDCVFQDYFPGGGMSQESGPSGLVGPPQQPPPPPGGGSSGGGGGGGGPNSRGPCAHQYKLDFVSQNYAAASNAASNLNTNPAFLLGLSANESDYGRDILATQYNNYFGLKQGFPGSGQPALVHGTMDSTYANSPLGQAMEASLNSLAQSTQGQRITGAGNAVAFVTALTVVPQSASPWAPGPFNSNSGYADIVLRLIAEVEALIDCLGL